MRSGLGWQSLDPMEAVAAVHSIENKNLLLRIAYEARNPEARRLALIKMGDKVSDCEEKDGQGTG